MGLHKAAGNSNLRACWLLVAGVSALAIALQFGGEQVREALAYTRDGVAGGELWRLVTGHFVHLGWTHMWLNLAGLALVVWLVGGIFSWVRWLLVLALTVLIIDVGFWFLYPNLAWYVGLSGVLHGLLVGGLLKGVVERDRESMILLGFVLAKLAWEQFSGGPLPGSEATSGGNVIVNAHLYGAVGGALAGTLLWRSAGSTRPI
ncbi:MAG: rhombosortase [Gammaproteobacteria bacterium]|nr:rhombosortase [Gammaproteobacteria bacterium]